MPAGTPRFAYDLFVSYARADDHDGWIGAFVESIKSEHAMFTSTPLCSRGHLVSIPDGRRGQPRPAAGGSTCSGAAA
jgi:hypothetical protein